MTGKESTDSQLAALFRLDVGPTSPWRDDELAAILRHQLAAPLEVDLDRHDPAASDRRSCRLPQESGRPKTFGQLLVEGEADIPRLEQTKHFAKAAAADGSLPPPIAAVLYLAAIGAAMRTGGHRITQLDDQALRSKLDWAVSQTWVDSRTRQLCRETISRLAPPNSTTR